MSVNRSFRPINVIVARLEQIIRNLWLHWLRVYHRFLWRLSKSSKRDIGKWSYEPLHPPKTGDSSRPVIYILTRFCVVGRIRVETLPNDTTNVPIVPHLSLCVINIINESSVSGDRRSFVGYSSWYVEEKRIILREEVALYKTRSYTKYMYSARRKLRVVALVLRSVYCSRCCCSSRVGPRFSPENKTINATNNK